MGFSGGYGDLCVAHFHSRDRVANMNETLVAAPAMARSHQTIPVQLKGCILSPEGGT